MKMNDSDLRSQSSGTVSWFEFLLNPSLLDRHLAHPSPEPSPTDLIISFLSKCSSFVEQQNSNGIKYGQLPMFGPIYPPEENEPEIIELEDEGNRKNQALKILALKIAASLKWDIGLLEKKLPLTMQRTLFLFLLKISGNEVKSNSLLPNGWSPNEDATFSRILYFTWVLYAFVEGSHASKNQKGLNVQIPGQVDPSFVPPATFDAIFHKLQSETDVATAALEEYIRCPARVRMPLLSCFGLSVDENLSLIQSWEQGLNLKEEEIVCQVSYALGRFYFFQERYDNAGKHFVRASNLYPKFQNALFCHIDKPKLDGFYSACAGLLNCQKPNAHVPLKEKLHFSVKSGHQDTVQILKMDNVKRELSVSLRDAVEINILHNNPSVTDLLLYVTFSNVLRRTIDGEVVFSDWCAMLKTNEEKSSLIFHELLKEINPFCTIQQRAFLKNFVQSLCLCSIPARVRLMKFEVLSSFMNNKELEELLNSGQHLSKREVLKLNKSFTNDPHIQMGSLERRLMSSEDPQSIREVVIQLRSNFGKSNLCSLKKKWELPRPISMLFKGIPPCVDQETVQILLSKANELRSIKNFRGARNLYQCVEGEIGNYSARFMRFLSSELLRLELLEILDTPVYVCHPPSYRMEVIEKILSFLNCFTERDFAPDPLLLELCAAVLLNFREWDRILDIGMGYGCHFEFSRIIALVCKDLFVNKGNKSAPKDLWDIILPIFANSLSGSTKRTSSAVFKESQRDFAPPIITRIAFQQFLTKLKDISCLGVIISCLAKFYNILKDDSVGEIFLEYQGLWPSSVANASMFNVNSVSEAFQSTLQNALSIHPTHSAWLRTKGDIMYVQGHYATALGYYLSAAMVSTDFFCLPMPKVLFDDLMFKHMIHCCTKLHNHTQAAILHQFLEESNYPGAFKALGEPVCNDNCDSYYDCIWDVTLLEYLINLHSRRGEVEFRNLVMQIIGQLELNSNNNEEIQREAANLRKGRFLRAMTKQFL